MVRQNNSRSFYPDEKLISFKHHPLKLAELEFDTSMKKMVLVTTINWTHANGNPTDVDYDPSKSSPDLNEVHKNEYLFTFEELIEFIRNTADVAEDVIAFEFIKDGN